MKTKLITALAIALILFTWDAATDTVNLSTGSGADAGMTIDLLITENSNDNVTIKLQYGFPATMMTAYNYHNIQCVDVGVPTFTLTADATNLPSFSFVNRWGPGCTAPNQLDTFRHYTYAVSYTASTGKFSTVSGSQASPVSGTTPDDTDSSVASNLKSFYNIATEVNGDTLANTLKFPRTGTTAYLKCFSVLNRLGVYTDSDDIASDFYEYSKDVTLTMPGTISTPSSTSSSTSSPSTAVSSAKKLLMLPALTIGLLTQIGT